MGCEGNSIMCKDVSISVDMSIPDELKDQTSKVQDSKQNEQKSHLEKSQSNWKAQNKAYRKKRRGLQKQKHSQQNSETRYNIMF